MCPITRDTGRIRIKKEHYRPTADFQISRGSLEIRVSIIEVIDRVSFTRGLVGAALQCPLVLDDGEHERTVTVLCLGLKRERGVIHHRLARSILVQNESAAATSKAIR